MEGNTHIVAVFHAACSEILRVFCTEGIYGTVICLYSDGVGSTSNDSSASLNASHLKVLSISDLKDLEIPDPTPTPDPKLTQTPEQIENKEKQLLATVQGVNLNILWILPGMLFPDLRYK